jgi:hypothetical protein
VAALLTRRNADGGFGESPSTPYATALALNALLSANGPTGTVQGATAWLQAHQLQDGSWGGVYATALAVTALRTSQGPNLLVPLDSLRFNPPSPTEGQVVTVSATVRNAGRAAAGAQRTRLYDGDPALGQVLGEASLGPLESGQESAVSFAFDTAGRPGTRTLFVVADAADDVLESREDDNAASRALSVAGLLPDLEVSAFDVAVSPYPPQEGETAAVAVTVHNRGQRASTPVVLDLTLGNPRNGGRPIGRMALPAVAADQATIATLSWDTTGQLGAHELFATVDSE